MTYEEFKSIPAKIRESSIKWKPRWQRKGQPFCLEFRNKRYLRHCAVRRLFERHNANIDWCVQKLTEKKDLFDGKRTSKAMAKTIVAGWERTA